MKRRVSSPDPDSSGTFLLERGIDVSNVALASPVDGKPIKVKWAWIDGKKERVSAKDPSIIIPRPKLTLARSERVPETGPFDTLPKDVAKVNFVPSILRCPIPQDCIL